MKLVAFNPDHAKKMNLQASQATAISDLPLEYLSAIQHAGLALSVLDGETVIACGGIARTDDYGTLWGYVSVDSKRYFVHLDRIVRKALNTCDLHRIEATVVTEFSAGHRWLSLLGFSKDKSLPNYGPNGEHCTLWVKECNLSH